MVSNHPFVSIVIVNYNYANETLSCVEECEELNYSNYQIIIVDNGSTDDSAEYLQNHIDNHTLILADENHGYPAGANLGIEQAIEDESKYILLLNNDARISAGGLSPLVESLERNPQAAAASGIIRYMDNSEVQYAGGEINEITGKADYTAEIKQDTEYETDLLLGAFILIRSRVLEEIGGLDEQYFFGHDDIDLSYEIRKRGYQILVDPSVTVYHEGRGVSESLTAFLAYYSSRNQIYFIRKQLNGISSLTAYLYFIISRIGIFVLGADFIGSRIEYSMATLQAIWDSLMRNELRGPEFFDNGSE